MVRLFSLVSSVAGVVLVGEFDDVHGQARDLALIGERCVVRPATAQEVTNYKWHNWS